MTQTAFTHTPDCMQRATLLTAEKQLKMACAASSMCLLLKEVTPVAACAEPPRCMISPFPLH